jgi:hypothetical protein
VGSVKFLAEPSDNESRITPNFYRTFTALLNDLMGIGRVSMVSRKRSALTLGLILSHLVSLVGPAVPMAEADTVPTTPATSYSPFNPSMTPVNFQVAQAQSLSNLYGSCFSVGQNQLDPLVNSIVQLTTGKGPKGDPTSCANVQADKCTIGMSTQPPACPMDRDERAINAIFDSALGQAQASNCCVKAKEGQLQEASKELGCISQQNELLANQIKSLQSTLQQNFQTAQKDLSQIETVITDRQNQLKFIGEKLGGGPGGTMGLLKLQNELQKVIASQLPQAVKGFEDTITGYNQQQQMFQQRVQNQKMALAKQCFASPDARYQCSVNSTDSCSFAQLIEAKYYELSRSVNGQIQRNNKSNQAQAQSKKAALDALFQSIFSNMASDTKLAATTQQEAQAQQAQAGDIYRIKTPQDILSLYGSQLAAFNIDGLDVKALFLNKFEQCYEDAQSTVTSSMSDPTSQYSLSVSFMQNQQKNIRDNFIQYYKTYGDMYTKFWSEMGVTAPLDTSKCTSSSTPISGMLQCAKDLATNLDGAYTGNTPNSSVTVMVKGNSTNPVTQFTFSCNGVNGCVTAMQNLTNNLTSESQKLEQTKKSYIQQANQSLEQFKNQMSQVLSVQNDALKARMTQLKSVLSKNGVNDPLTMQPIQKEPLRKGENGLYEMPDNLLAVIGGDFGMIDPNSGSFDNARTAIAQAIQNFGQKDSESARMMAELMNVKQACLSKFKEELGRRSLSYIDEYSRQCLPTVCATKPKSYIDSLISTISEAAPSGLPLKDEVGARLDGWGEQCDSLREKNGAALTSLRDACGNLQYCKRSEVSSDIDGYCHADKSISFSYADDSAAANSSCATSKKDVSKAFNEYRQSLVSQRKLTSCDAITNKAVNVLQKVHGNDTDESTAGEAD